MDTEVQNLSFFSWPPANEESTLYLPYFDDNDILPPFLDSWRDSYDLLPLPACLEHEAVPLACLPPPAQLHCSEEAMDCYTYSSPWEGHLTSSDSHDQEEYLVVHDPMQPSALPAFQAMVVASADAANCSAMETEGKSLGGRKVAERRSARSAEIGLEEIKAYFHKPITRAAMEMNVGLTVLKKRCRDLGITRWPHRKMKSLNTLIHNIEELGKGAVDTSIQKELESLQAHRKLMEENPEIQLTEKTKKLRQACFKANYKRRIALQSYLHPLQSIAFR